METSSLTELRSRFPVLEQTAYLNSGSCGPLSWDTADALGDATTRAAVVGRAMPYFEAMLAAHGRLRLAYAEALGARSEDVALTTSTTDGLTRILMALRLRPGDEVVTSEDEHPGLLGPLAALRDLCGVTVKAVPLADVADAVGPATKAVAVSHVSWITGARAPEDALREVGRSIPVLYDGAQGAGAIAVEPDTLGCAAYTGAGQKWLCGPVGLGLLWVSPAWSATLRPLTLAYGNLEVPSAGLDAVPWPDARRFDASAISGEQALAAAVAAERLAEVGWETIFTRARDLADRLEATLRERGHSVAPRDRTTLTSFAVDDPAAVRDRLAEQGVIVRDLPGHPYIRVSTGAWNDESDLERLLAAL